MHGQHSKVHRFFKNSPSTNYHQLPVVPQLEVRTIIHFSLHARMLTGICVDTLVRCEKTSTNPRFRTDQNKNTTKVQLGEPMIFIGVTDRNIGEELLTGTEMTQRVASSKPTTAHES